jgi:V/A-type H+/Na+-transporting ATPase subunit A
VKLPRTGGAYINRGVSVDSLDTAKLWDVHITISEGQEVSGGTIIAEVPETSAIIHKSMIPPTVHGHILSVMPDGKYTISDTIAVLQLEDGSEMNLTLTQKWPIRIPRPTLKRYPCF